MPLIAKGLFCETDKYCREAVPELASTRKRIKTRFTRSAEAIPLFFPPKWEINDHLPTVSVFGDGQADAPAEPMVMQEALR